MAAIHFVKEGQVLRSQDTHDLTTPYAAVTKSELLVITNKIEGFPTHCQARV